MLSVSQVPETTGSKEGNCGRKQTKGFSDFDILVPSLIFIANKQGLPDCTFRFLIPTKLYQHSPCSFANCYIHGAF